MKTFADSANRTWTIAINVDAIKRVKSLVEVDLLEVVNGKLIDRLVSDPILLCDVLFCLCKPEADAKSVSDADFGRSMAGDVIDLATTAFLEELVDFFPSRRRPVLQKALSRIKALESKVLAAAGLRMDSPEIDRAIEAAMKKSDQEFDTMLLGSGIFSTKSPGSSESTPAP